MGSSTSYQTGRGAGTVSLSERRDVDSTYAIGGSGSSLGINLDLHGFQTGMDT